MASTAPRPRARLLAAAATTASSALTVLALGQASASCAARGAPPVVAVEVAIAPMPDAAAVAPAPGVTTASNRCDARVNAGKIRTGASCQLDEQVSTGAGTLRYPCTDDGPAELTVGTHVYTGSLLQGRLALELGTELDWDDGCHWETHQTITGMLRGGTLRWAYSEKPVGGQGCFAACTASAELKITGPVAPDDDDEDP